MYSQQEQTFSLSNETAGFIKTISSSQTEVWELEELRHIDF
jgi:hypothetical protein